MLRHNAPRSADCFPLPLIDEIHNFVTVPADIPRRDLHPARKSTALFHAPDGCSAQAGCLHNFADAPYFTFHESPLGCGMSKLLRNYSNCNLSESIEIQSTDGLLQKNIQAELSGWMNKEKKCAEMRGAIPWKGKIWILRKKYGLRMRIQGAAAYCR
jgi:hypothetical protein